MTKKENLFQEHYQNLFDYWLINFDAQYAAEECVKITLAYHKKCLELILEEWTKGKFQEPLNAIIRREIDSISDKQ